MASGPTGAFVSAPLTLGDAALFTDLYELTMAAALFREGVRGSATFSLFVRRLPPERGFLVAAGLADVLEYLRGFRFSQDGLDYLRSLGRFEPAFLAFLETLRFTGQVRAMREGTVLFAEEPLLEITAPLIEAQLLETAVINICHLQTLLASKAARSVLAASGRSLSEFGLRRSHGTDAGMKAARCAILAGFDSTSNVLAGRTYGAPLSGTMAHSFVTAFPREIDAFLAYARAFPDSAVLLLDTYDTAAAARLAVEVARRLAADGHRLAGVRLDSGDLLAPEPRGPGDPRRRRLSRRADPRERRAGRARHRGAAGRRRADRRVRNRHAARRVGGRAVARDGVQARGARRARHPQAEPGQGDLGRREAGRPAAGCGWAARRETRWRSKARTSPAGSETLLEPVMRDGRSVGPAPALAALREHCTRQLAALPEGLRRLRGPESYPVASSDDLRARQAAAKDAAIVSIHHGPRRSGCTPLP